MPKNPTLATVAQVLGAGLAIATAVGAYSHLAGNTAVHAQAIVADLATEHGMVVLDLRAERFERAATVVTVDEDGTLRPALVLHDDRLWSLYLQTGDGYELLDQRAA